MKRKFLIVDKDTEIIGELTRFFEKYGIESDNVSNAEDARALLKKNHYDLAVMEVILPEESGIELTKWIKAHTDVPVILLTHLCDTIDTAVGLEIGADDYIYKPFEPRLLLARINAVLRAYKHSKFLRNQKNRNLLDIKNRSLTIDGTDISLNSTEYDFMKILLDYQGNAVSREKLFEIMFEKSWNPEDRAIDNIVNRLRKKIEQQPDKPKYIITVRHKGYLTPEGLIDTSI